MVHPPLNTPTTLTNTSYPITVAGDDAFSVTGQVRVEYGDSSPEIAVSAYSLVTVAATCSRDAPTNTATHTATPTSTPIGTLPTVRNLLYACGDNGSDAVITWTTDHFTAPAIAGFSGGWVVTSGDFLEVYTRPWPTPVETSPGHWQTSHNFAAQFGLDPGDEFIIFFVDVFIDFDGGRQSSAAEYAVQVTCTVRAATDTPTHTSTATSTSTNTATATATPTLGVPSPPATVTIDCAVAVTSTVVSLSWDPSPARFQRVDFHTYRVNLDFDPNDDADIVHPPANSAVRLTATSYQVTVMGDAAFTVTGQVQVQYGDTVPEITTSIDSAITAASTCARAPPTATHTFTATATHTSTATATHTSTATATHTATATATPTLGVPPPATVTIDCVVAVTSTVVSLSWDPSPARFKRVDLHSYRVNLDFEPNDDADIVHPPVNSAVRLTATSYQVTVTGDAAFTVTGQVQVQYGDTVPEITTSIYSSVTAASTCARAPATATHTFTSTATATHTATATATPTLGVPPPATVTIDCAVAVTSTVVSLSWDPSPARFQRVDLHTYRVNLDFDPNDDDDIVHPPANSAVRLTATSYQVTVTGDAAFTVTGQVQVQYGDTVPEITTSIYSSVTAASTCARAPPTATHTATATATHTSTATATHTATFTAIPTLGVPPPPATVTIDCALSVTSTVVSLSWDPSPARFKRVDRHGYRVNLDFEPNDDDDIVHPPVNSSVRLTATSYRVTVTGDAAFTVTGQVQVQYGDTVPEITTSIYSSVTAASTCARAPATATHTATATATHTSTATATHTATFTAIPTLGVPPATVTIDCAVAVTSTVVSLSWDPSPARFQRVDRHSYRVNLDFDPNDDADIVHPPVNSAVRLTAASYQVTVIGDAAFTVTGQVQVQYGDTVPEITTSIDSAITAASTCARAPATATNTNTATFTATPTLGVPPPPDDVTIACAFSVTTTAITLSWAPSPARFQRVDRHTYRVNLDFEPNDDDDLIRPPVNSAVRLTATSYQVTISGDAAFTLTGQVQVQYGDTVPEITTSRYSAVTAASTCTRAPATATPTSTHTSTHTATATHTATSTATATPTPVPEIIVALLDADDVLLPEMSPGTYMIVHGNPVTVRATFRFFRGDHRFNLEMAPTDGSALDGAACYGPGMLSVRTFSTAGEDIVETGNILASCPTGEYHVTVNQADGASVRGVNRPIFVPTKVVRQTPPTFTAMVAVGGTRAVNLSAVGAEYDAFVYRISGGGIVSEWLPLEDTVQIPPVFGSDITIEARGCIFDTDGDCPVDGPIASAQLTLPALSDPSDEPNLNPVFVCPTAHPRSSPTGMPRPPGTSSTVTTTSSGT